MNKKLFIGRDVPFNLIDNEICRVLNFNALAKIENNKVISTSATSPYAFCEIYCKKLQENAFLNISHKIDFINLTTAFDKKKNDQEVIICYSVKNYKKFFFKIFSAMMPKLWIIVCPKGAYELMTNPKYKPELGGEARFLAQRPVLELKPDIMK